MILTCHMTVTIASANQLCHKRPCDFLLTAWLRGLSLLFPAATRTKGAKHPKAAKLDPLVCYFHSQQARRCQIAKKRIGVHVGACQKWNHNTRTLARCGFITALRCDSPISPLYSCLIPFLCIVCVCVCVHACVCPFAYHRVPFPCQLFSSSLACCCS